MTRLAASFSHTCTTTARQLPLELPCRSFFSTRSHIHPNWIRDWSWNPGRVRNPSTPHLCGLERKQPASEHHSINREPTRTPPHPMLQSDRVPETFQFPACQGKL